MKLSNLKLHNFRGVLDQQIDVHPYTLLVGPNNAGKSTFIDAIRAFYEKDGYKFKQDNDFPFKQTADDESWLELTFQLTNDEHDSLKEEYQTDDNTLRVRKFFKTSQKSEGKSATGVIFGYTADGKLSDSSFYGAKNVQSGKFGDLIYIPAVSKVDEHAKLSGPSALRDLLNDMMSAVVEAGGAYADFSKSVELFAQSILKERTEDQRSLEAFQESFNELLSPWQTKFSLRFPTPSAAEIVKQMVRWEIADEFCGKPQDVDYFGSGFQRHFIYCLIQLGARFIGRAPSKKSKDFSPNMTLVLFEEPEAFLHPPQQEMLARNLMGVAKNGDWQVVCATHSSQFVSRNAASIPAIVRVQRPDGVIEVHQLDSAQWKTIVDANQAINAIVEKFPKMKDKLHDDDRRAEMEAVKHLLWLNSDRSGMFFADHVLIVEGPTEVALIAKLIDDGKISADRPGLHIIDSIGKYNMHRFMNLLSKLGIAHSVIYDDDSSIAEHIELNELINDSKDPKWTHSVQAIPKNLEAFLGLPVPKPHRKPQHALYHYTSGQIQPQRLTEFCDLVSATIQSSRSNVMVSKAT